MASRKQMTLLALAGLIATASFGQKNDADYSWVLDSSKRSVKNMPQQNEFMNNTYPYPAKPRDMWEIGLSGGNMAIIGDRPFLASKYTGGIGGGLSIRKSLSHTFSVRAGWEGSMVSIPHYKPNSALPVIVSYAKNKTHMLNLDLIATLNNISSYRGNPKLNIYGLLGYSLVASQTEIKGGGSFRGNINVEGNNALITTFGGDEPLGYDNQALFHAISYGAGLAYKLSDRINIGVEERITSPLSGFDGLDGAFKGNSGDRYAFSSARINFNLGNPSKAVQPLWWLNPNNYIYNEVNTPKHMKIPTPVLPDADGDGITDQFDMEPNTPSGCPVDSHGVSRDTDGDGVPDCKDKEPLTARECFPVDADGIGKCPEPPCCAELRSRMDSLRVTCDLGSLPSVQFKSGSLTLSATAKAVLNNIAQQLNANPNCNVRVSGYYEASSKRSQQLGWDRVNTIIKYLSEQQGISESRLIWNLSAGGDPNTVDFMGTTETGPNSIPAPFPNLQKSK